MPLTDNLSAYWRLSEASGTRVDSGPSGTANLSDTNSVGSVSDGPLGGNAAHFESTSSQLLSRADTTAIDIQTTTQDWTLTAWVRYESWTNCFIIGKTNSFTSLERCVYGLRGFNTGAIQGRVGNGSTAGSAGFSGPLTIGQWYFVVVWHDAVNDTINIQVNNGSPNSVTYTAGTYNNTYPVGLGNSGQPVSGQYFDGDLAHVGLWKRVLTSDERSELWNGGLGLDPTATPGNASGSIFEVSVVAPNASASGTIGGVNGDATGSLPAVTLSAPSVTVSGNASISAPFISLAVSGPAGTVEAGASGVGSIPAVGVSLPIAAAAGSAGVTAAGATVVTGAPSASAAGAGLATASLPTGSVATPTGQATGAGTSTADLPPIVVGAPGAGGTGDSSVSVTPGSLTLGAPSASAVGSATAVGSFFSVTVVPPEGSTSSSSNGSAVGALSSVGLTPPAANVSADVSVSSGLPVLSLVPPSATATGGASVDAGISTVFLTPPAGSASPTVFATGSFSAFLLIPPAAGATGAASVNLPFPGIAVLPPEAYIAANLRYVIPWLFEVTVPDIDVVYEGPAGVLDVEYAPEDQTITVYSLS